LSIPFSAILLFWWAAVHGSTRIPPARPLPSDEPEVLGSIAFFEARVASDPGDTPAQNRLGSLYLQRLRQTGDHGCIAFAERAALASLAFVPAPQNSGAVSLLAQARAASHRFADARDLTEALIAQSEKGELYGTLGDALAELGDYGQASVAYERMEALGPDDLGTLTRLARFDYLHGRVASAQERLLTALEMASARQQPPRETLAWIRWQLGELAFSVGDYASAEAWYRSGLVIHPTHVALLGSLGRLLAGGGRTAEAIRFYERAIAIDPVPPIVASLADVYALEGNESRSHELLESIGTDPLDGRHIANIHADHGVHVEEAYALARDDWSRRQDVFGADTLAWTALKAGHLEEARAAMVEARRLGTRDARMLYHAGMIALAAGRPEEGRRLLRASLALNPRFDLLQSRRAREALVRNRK
jgi:tetratricopeptide (TPR) repeat protein